MRIENPRQVVGQHKAILFNERFQPGALVAVRRTPGDPPSWDRVFAPAYGAGDCAMVELASSLIPVDTDLVFDCPADLPGMHEQEQEQPHRDTAWAQLVLAFVLGAAAMVLLALVFPHAPAAAVTEAVGADMCTSQPLHGDRI
ncbi:MAG: hypothetical protein JSS57_00230 [Proteobacteria bacterium]|nr:hypothetical protein [Pseudomonadota bacterium]